MVLFHASSYRHWSDFPKPPPMKFDRMQRNVEPCARSLGSSDCVMNSKAG